MNVTYIHVCNCVFVHVCMHVCMGRCVYICMYLYLHVYNMYTYFSFFKLSSDGTVGTIIHCGEKEYCIS